MSAPDLAVLRRIRGNAKGQVTRTSQMLNKIRARPVIEYARSNVDRCTADLDKAEQSFTESHQALFDADSTFTEDQFLAGQDEHQMIYDAAVTTAQYISACVVARDKGNDILLNIQGLQSNMLEGYDASVADEFAHITTDLREHASLLSVHGASENPDLQEMRRHILSKWSEVRRIHADSGYEPPTPGGGPSPTASASPSSAPKAQALAVALPSFSGKTTEFPEFKTLFLSIIGRQKHLSDDEKKALLLEHVNIRLKGTG